MFRGSYLNTMKVETWLAILSWFVQSFITDIKAGYSMENVRFIIRWSDDGVADAVELLLRLSPPGAFCDLVVLHIRNQNWKLVNLLLAYGADPHLFSSTYCDSGNAETPLSLAVYSSWAFTAFRNVLHRREFDLEDFARQELKEGRPLRDACWRMETLTALLELDFEPDIGPCRNEREYYRCGSCGRLKCWFTLQVQPYWQGVLESSKNGTYPPRSYLDTQDEPFSTSHNHLATSDKDSPISTTEGSESSNDSAILEAEAAQPDRKSVASETDTSRTVFGRDEIWCIRCWRHFKKTGHRRTHVIYETQSSDSDDSSDDGFSPYLFNT